MINTFKSIYIPGTCLIVHAVPERPCLATIPSIKYTDYHLRLICFFQGPVIINEMRAGFCKRVTNLEFQTALSLNLLHSCLLKPRR